MDSSAFDFTVRSSSRDYNVHFIEDLAPVLKTVLKPGDKVIIDRAVFNLRSDVLSDVLTDENSLKIDATEEQKSYAEVIPIFEYLIEGGFKRDNRLIAIGGGITQDTTAFIASLLYRGVTWIFFPTTLLAQADSCIGSKTSINFGQYKNQLGGFYAPEDIYIDLGFIQTLPELDVLSGLGEMAHYFPIAGEADFTRFADEFDAARTDPKVLMGLVSRSLEIKKGYIERDEFDRGPRQVFNYGHSFGHAIESVTQYRIPHGIAVSYGMDMANFISEKLGLMDSSMRNAMRPTLKKAWSIAPLGEMDQPKYEAALRRDKKNRGTDLGLILTAGFGDMFKKFVPLDNQFSEWLSEYFAAIREEEAGGTSV